MTCFVHKIPWEGEILDKQRLEKIVANNCYLFESSQQPIRRNGKSEKSHNMNSSEKDQEDDAQVDACEDMSPTRDSITRTTPFQRPSHLATKPRKRQGSDLHEQETKCVRPPPHDGSQAMNLPSVPVMHLTEHVMAPIHTFPFHYEYHPQQSFTPPSPQIFPHPNQQVHYANHPLIPSNQQFRSFDMADVITPSPGKKGRMNISICQPVQHVSYIYPHQQFNIAPNEPQKQDVQNPNVLCNCVKSRCLKLYCDCFKAEELCNTFCKCLSCRNVYSESLPGGSLYQAKSAYNIHKPGSFGKKAKKTGQGCSCKNNRCLKKYCNCFRNTISCSEKCSCIDCANATDSKEV